MSERAIPMSSSRYCGKSPSQAAAFAFLRRRRTGDKKPVVRCRIDDMDVPPARAEPEWVVESIVIWLIRKA